MKQAKYMFLYEYGALQFQIIIFFFTPLASKIHIQKRFVFVSRRQMTLAIHNVISCTLYQSSTQQIRLTYATGCVFRYLFIGKLTYS